MKRKSRFMRQFLRGGNPIESFALFIYKKQHNKNQYLLHKSNKVYGKNALLCPIIIPKLSSIAILECILEDIEEDTGIRNLQNTYDRDNGCITHIGKYISNTYGEEIIDCYSIESSLVYYKEKFLEKSHFNCSWISEAELEDHICEDEFVYGGLVFCYMKYLLLDSNT